MLEYSDERSAAMRRSSLIFAALLSSSVAFPALAALEPVGSVDFSMRDRHDSQFANLTADGLALTARNSDVSCDSVTATFGNGQSREIFRGELPRGQTVNVDLPGRDRTVERVDFNCHPLEGWRARVDVAADTGGGRYYDRENPLSGIFRSFERMR
jgi:hypothetical protein